MMDTLALFKDPFSFVSGIYYGIPTCCICSFISTPINERSDDVKQLCSEMKVGFVPCSECAKRILDGEVQPDELIHNRHAKKEFPRSLSPSDEFQNDDDQFITFIRLLDEITINVPEDIKTDLRRRIGCTIYN